MTLRRASRRGKCQFRQPLLSNCTVLQLGHSGQKPPPQGIFKACPGSLKNSCPFLTTEAWPLNAFHTSQLMPEQARSCSSASQPKVLPGAQRVWPRLATLTEQPRGSASAAPAALSTHPRSGPRPTLYRTRKLWGCRISAQTPWPGSGRGQPLLPPWRDAGVRLEVLRQAWSAGGWEAGGGEGPRGTEKLHPRGRCARGEGDTWVDKCPKLEREI